METNHLYKSYARKDIERFIAHVLLTYGRENIPQARMMESKHELFGRDNKKFGALLSDLRYAGIIVTESDEALEARLDGFEGLREYTITDEALEELRRREFSYLEYISTRLPLSNNLVYTVNLSALQTTGAITIYRMKDGTPKYKLNLELIQNGLI